MFMNFEQGKKLARIAVVDDDTAASKHVSNHINALENCKVVMLASEGQEFLDKLQEAPQIDLVILDIMMDGLDGYTTAEVIRAKYPATRVLFFSMCKTELALARMAASGGHGLIRKWGGSLKITEAINAVMNECYFFPDMEEMITISDGNFSKEKHLKLVGLTSLEIGFLKLVGTEKTYKEIADCLQIDTRQVDYIREGLFKRLNVKSRVGMAILAYQSGILPLAKTG